MNRRRLERQTSWDQNSSTHNGSATNPSFFRSYSIASPDHALQQQLPSQHFGQNIFPDLNQAISDIARDSLCDLRLSNSSIKDDLEDEKLDEQILGQRSPNIPPRVATTRRVQSMRRPSDRTDSDSSGSGSSGDLNRARLRSNSLGASPDDRSATVSTLIKIVETDETEDQEDASMVVEPKNEENSQLKIIITPGSENELVDPQLELSTFGDPLSDSIRSPEVRFRVGPESPPIDRKLECQNFNSNHNDLLIDSLADSSSDRSESPKEKGRKRGYYKASNTIGQESYKTHERGVGCRKTGRQEETLIQPTDSFRQRHQQHELFIELDELYVPCTLSGLMEWRETGRWIRYEETVEAGSDRWGKPHVPSLSFHSLLELRHCIETGTIIMDLEIEDTFHLMEEIVERVILADQIRTEDRNRLLNTLVLHHRHVNDPHVEQIPRQQTFNSLHHYFYRQQSIISPAPFIISPHVTNRSQSIVGNRNGRLEPSFVYSHNGSSANVEHGNDPGTTMDALLEQSSLYGSQRRLRMPKLGNRKKSEFFDYELMKRIPPGSEAALIMVGAVSYLERPAIAFVRITNAIKLPHVIEVPLPIKFVFVLLGPLDAGLDFHEVGRSISTLLSNRRFQEVAYEARGRTALVHAINEFMDDSIVFPPGELEQKALMPYTQIKNTSHWLRERRKALTAQPADLEKFLQEETQKWLENPLRRTGKCFGGLRRECIHRFELYWSDFTDAITFKCVSSVLFIFLTCFFPAITFGAILSEDTDSQIGVKETLLATSVGGIIFALASAQPLMLIGVAGPLLIFEESLYMFCKVNTLDFLMVRFWVSVWAMGFCLITVAWEGPLLIKYVTRFSDDILSTLISVIFISECIGFVTKMFSLHPVLVLDQYCTQNNISNYLSNTFGVSLNNTIKTRSPTTDDYFGMPSRQPNTSLLSCILVFGTFVTAFVLRRFRNSTYFGRKVRTALGDFGLSIAIITMVLFDRYVLQDRTVTSKLSIDSGLQPTSRTHWIISFSPPIWVPFAAVLPGILLFLILFIETEVAEMMLAKKETCLKKGTGYHWDLFLTGLLLVVSATFGLPWLCAGPVRSMAHVDSLTRFKLRAPGQKPIVSGVVEQRLTGVVLHLLIGLTILATNVLRVIPIAVLFGVFLYLGIMNMYGVQMISRTILFFVPVKYHPITVYCLRVRTWRMHLYSVIQLVCFAFVGAMKSIKTTAFAFPFAIMVAIFIRHIILPYFFTNFELLALDGEEEEQEEDMDFYEESRYYRFKQPTA